MLYTLWALFAPLWRDPRGGASSHREAAGAFASPLLVFVVAVLFSFVSILVTGIIIAVLVAKYGNVIELYSIKPKSIIGLFVLAGRRTRPASG